MKVLEHELEPYDEAFPERYSGRGELRYYRCKVCGLIVYSDYTVEIGDHEWFISKGSVRHWRFNTELVNCSEVCIREIIE